MDKRKKRKERKAKKKEEENRTEERRKKTWEKRKKVGEKKREIFPAFRRSKLDGPRIKVGPHNESYAWGTKI